MTSSRDSSPSPARGTRLATPEDFDYARMLAFLGPRSVASMEITRPDIYVRTIWLDAGSLRALRGPGADAPDFAGSDFAGPVTLAVVPDADGGSMTIHSAPVLPDAVRRLLVTRMFDLDADLDAFSAAVSRDRVLGPLVRNHARLRLPQLLDPFEGLVRAVLGQQVSVKGASTMVDRVVRRLGTAAPALDGIALPRGPGSPTDASAPAVGAAVVVAAATELGDAARLDATRLLAFPRPDAMVDAGPAELQNLGLTRAKAATLFGLASAAKSGALDCVRLRSQSPDDAQAALVALPGIGPWTASYVRMRALGDRDAFPITDLGVIKALDARGVPRDRHTIVSDRWRPWRAYATLHLWQSLSPAP